MVNIDISKPLPKAPECGAIWDAPNGKVYTCNAPKNHGGQHSQYKKGLGRFPIIQARWEHEHSRKEGD